MKIKEGLTSYKHEDLSSSKQCQWWIEEYHGSCRLIVESNTHEMWYVACYGSLDYCYGYLIGRFGIITHVNGEIIYDGQCDYSDIDENK